MHTGIAILFMITMTNLAAGQDFTNLDAVNNTVEKLKEAFMEKKPKKKVKPKKNEYAGMGPEQIEKLEIQKERERRLKEQQIDRNSDDFLLQDPNLSDRYQRGSYLVYDCKEMHWVCTAKAEFDRCKQLRDKALELKLNNLQCADFEKFASVDECIKHLTWQTNYQPQHRFCIGEQLKRYHFEY